MKRVILESPYSSGTPTSIAAVVARNERYLAACLKDSLSRGEAPFASHGLYTRSGVLDDTDPEERKRGMEAGFAWIEAADMTVAYLDLGMSRGMVMGIAQAKALGHPIEERLLGGVWEQCCCPAFERSVSTDYLDYGQHHVSACPKWRAAAMLP